MSLGWRAAGERDDACYITVCEFPHIFSKFYVIQMWSQEFATRAGYKTRVWTKSADQSVPQEGPTRAIQEWPVTRVIYKIALQEHATRAPRVSSVSYKSGPEQSAQQQCQKNKEFPTRVSCKSAPRVPYKRALQEHPRTVPH